MGASKEYKAVKNLVMNTGGMSRDSIREIVKEAVKEVLKDMIRDEAFRASIMRSIMREMFGRGGYAPMNTVEIRDQIAKRVMDHFEIDVKKKP